MLTIGLSAVLIVTLIILFACISKNINLKMEVEELKIKNETQRLSYSSVYRDYVKLLMNTYECELDDDSMDILRNWVIKRAELLNKRDCNALFISNRRTRITDKSVRDLVKAYTADFEKHITPHKFRSTFATLLYDQTGDIAYVQQLMNHSRPDTTQRYIVRKPINAEAAKYVNSLLK